MNRAGIGCTGIVYSLDDVLRNGGVMNLFQADERNRIVDRKIPPYDYEAFREAGYNAFTLFPKRWTERMYN